MSNLNMKTAVIIEDNAINRFAFRKTLEELNIEVVAECDNYADGLETVISHKPDIVLMDHNLNGCKGIDIYKAVSHVVKNTRFIYITAESNLGTMLEIINSGISNVLLKKTGIEDLKNAINKIIEGNSYVDQDIAKNIILYNRITTNLSRRDKKIVNLLIQKRKIEEIAELTNLTDRTIRRKKTNIIHKIGRNQFNQICCKF